jgi:hypothetical protein
MSNRGDIEVTRQLTGDELAPPKLSANELRYLAEKADGMRDQAVSLIVDGDKVDVVATKAVGTRKRLLDLATPARGPGIAGDAKTQIFWRGKIYGGPNTELDEADALFVTQSAIEKFLLPYYMRFKSGAQVQALENMLFNNPAAVAALHIPPSITKKWPRVGVVNLTEGSPITFDLV